MPSYAVVKAHDIVGHIFNRFQLIRILALPHPFHLEVQEEAFHHRIIPTIPFAAYTASNAVLIEQRLIFTACELAAPV